MREAVSRLNVAMRSDQAFLRDCEAAGLLGEDAFWDWYQVQPVRMVYRQALENALHSVEAAFMRGPESWADEDAVMDALTMYEQIAPSAFAIQCARDLFTPPRYQSYPHETVRHWLLYEPDEMFAKSPMPDFLLRMRDEHQGRSVV